MASASGGLQRGMVTLLFAAILAACSDLPSAPASPSTGSRAAADQGALSCRASPRERSVSCGVEEGGGPRADLVIGGQHQFVNVISDSVTYDSATGRFSFIVLVQNLIPQALGSIDGVTPDTGGVKLFLSTLPTVTRGAGEVALLNADGAGTFTASGQPFFRVAEILPPLATSAARRWELHVPPTAVTFSFTMYLYAAVPRPLGWVRISPEDTVVVSRGGRRLLSASVFRAVGTSIAGAPVAWSVRDTSVAHLDGSDVVGGAMFGQTEVIAASKGVADSIVVRVGIPPLADIRTSHAHDLESGHTCGLDTAGRAYCWGSNIWGEFGVGTSGLNESSISTTPLSAFRGTRRFLDLGVGEQFTCGLEASGQTWCWGLSSWGRLGNGRDEWVTIPTPAPVVQNGIAFVALSTGTFASCGLDAGGQAYCWGTAGSAFRAMAPVPVSQGPLRFVQVAVGYYHICGLTPGGQAYCLGMGSKLGDGIGKDSPTPVPVAQAGRSYVELRAGTYSTCGITAAHQVYCWGDNGDGQLGDGTTTASLVPVPVRQGGVGFVQVSPGLNHTCALSVTGKAFCWGANGYGQLGIGTRVSSSVPVAVRQNANATWVRIEAGSYDTCGLSPAGEAFCWGIDQIGQVGIGVVGAQANEPVPVSR